MRTRLLFWQSPPFLSPCFDFFYSQARLSSQVWRPKAKPDNDGFFDFMFAKPGNDYGKGLTFSDSKLSKSMMTNELPGEVATKKGEGLYQASEAPPAQVPLLKPTLEGILSSYEHETKKEHPVYQTTSNAIGFKRPDKATYTLDRVSIPQEFSQGFNNIKYRDQGLNTSMSKSTVHSKLDPQFL
jgi:hypothetical protein